MPESGRERKELLATLFGDRVAFACGDPTEPQSPALPEEEALLAGAAEHRCREFRSGRAAAHEALTALGVSRAPLLKGPRGEPRWPAGFVGSISHGETLSAAVVARSSDYAGLGLDVETDAPVSQAFARRVCSQRELQRCADLGEPETLARVVFSAKESVYKLQYPLTQTVVYWSALEILLNSGNFSARFLNACPPFRMEQVLHGSWVRGQGVILTGLALATSPGDSNHGE